MMYYYLKPDELIQANDEWTVDEIFPIWRTCGTSCEGYTVQGWDDTHHCEEGWRVRRKITKTKLGNIL